MRVPLMLFSLEKSRSFSHRYMGAGRLLKGFTPSLDTDLLRAEMEITADEYRFASMLSAFAWAIAFFVLIGFAMVYMTGEIRSSLLVGFAAGLVLFAMMLIVILRYPKIIAGKESEQVDKDLVYALKDLLLSISSGLSMFTSLTLVSRGSYGYVSKDLKRVISKVNTGMPLEDALEELAISTPSEHFQNALWQIINTSKSGAGVEGVIRGLVDSLVAEQRSNIQKYSNELNVLTLMYMLAAVAIPTIITTLMIILNAFVSAGSNEIMFIIFIILSFFVQLVIIGFVKSRRPEVHV
jgi:pilus assembly protein TadC